MPQLSKVCRNFDAMYMQREVIEGVIEVHISECVVFDIHAQMYWLYASTISEIIYRFIKTDSI